MNIAETFYLEDCSVNPYTIWKYNNNTDTRRELLLVIGKMYIH